jgi:hypothetical protein
VIRHWLFLSGLLYNTLSLAQQAVIKDGGEAMLQEDKTWIPSGTYPDFTSRSLQEAITDNQTKVLLSKEGTWTYADPKTENLFENIPVNKESFEKKSTAGSLVKSKIVFAGVYFDPEKWKVTEEQHENGANEYQFRYSSNTELQGSFGSYRNPYSQPTIEKAKNSVISVLLKSPEIKVKKKEFRKVNGTDTFYVRFYETHTGYEVIQNHFVTNAGYYVVTEAAIPEKMFSKNEIVMEEFINGGVKLTTEKLMHENAAAPVPPPMPQKN